MTETSPRLALPFIQPAQAQKHVTHNEAIERLDIIVQLTVVDVDATTPPASPSEGQTWALGPAPNGAWADQDGTLACYRGGGWMFLQPQTGWRAYCAADAQMRLYDGINWVVDDGGTVSFDNLQGVGINATADATNRLSVAAEATLLNNEGAGHQLKINKAGASDTASLLFQSAFSGRAEMGLAGTDDFSVKVGDGSVWYTGFTVQGTDGKVQVNELLSLPPRTEPLTGAAGDIYFDSATAKLRCFDGAIWQDLF
ncbi:MAG: DUF2793 domain-containing protein [Pseudomonadota bacterium]